MATPFTPAKHEPVPNSHSLGVDCAHLLADLRVVDSCRRAKICSFTGRVVDNGTILRADTRRELTDMLAAHERATGDQSRCGDASLHCRDIRLRNTAMSSAAIGHRAERQE